VRFFEADVKVEEAAGACASGAGVRVVGLVSEDADGGGRDGLVGDEGPDIG
jgi:hypothetical protein